MRLGTKSNEPRRTRPTVPVAHRSGRRPRAALRGRRAHKLAVLVVTALGLAQSAQAACPQQEFSLTQRFDAADAAVVGRVTAVRSGSLNGQPERVVTIDVDQHVKGNLPNRIVVWSPTGQGSCDLPSPSSKAFGLLLSRSPDGRWVATGASVVDPGQLVVEGGKPRGGVIKVAVGLVILAVVLLWALRRLKTGKRPDLPGAPQP